MRAPPKLVVKTFDWLSWFPCTLTAPDRLLLQWRRLTTWPLTWLVQLWHIKIWPLTWLVKVPHKPPPPFACLYKPRVCGNKADPLWRRIVSRLSCRGAGLAESRLTSLQDPLALLRGVPLPLSFCGAPPAIYFSPKIIVAPQKEFLPQWFSYLLFLMCPCEYTVTHANIWAAYYIPQFNSYLSKSCLPLVS